MERLMALDVGDRTIGVAVSDLLMITAQGVTTIRRQSNKLDFEELEKIIKEYSVTKIVVGMPKNMNGTVGPQGEKVLKFTEKLKEQFDLPIDFQDERLTTVMAEKLLIDADMSRKKRKKIIDKMAAIQILTTYMERNKRSGF